MSVLLAILAAMPQTTDRSRTAIICSVGQVALKDLPNIDQNPAYQHYYGRFRFYQPDLFKTCPHLQRLLPKQYPPADADAVARAEDSSPIRPQTGRPAMIFSIGIPEISSDGNSAKVSFGYFCSGLCGGYLIGYYVHSHKGWVRDGQLHTMMVS